MTDIPKLDKMIRRLHRLKGKIADIDTVNAWSETLMRFEEKDIANAFGQVLQMSGWFEIKQVLDILNPIPDLKIKCMEAWEMCIKFTSNCGDSVIYNKAIKLPENIKRALEISGGILKLRYCTNEYVKSEMEKKFRACYEESIKNDILKIENNRFKQIGGK